MSTPSDASPASSPESAPSSESNGSSPAEGLDRVAGEADDTTASRDAAVTNDAATNDAATNETTASEADENAGGVRAAEQMNETETTVLDSLRSVIDPELMVNIVDLGLVYDVRVDGEKADVAMTLTSPSCPAGPQIVHQAKMAVEGCEAITESNIRLTMSPPWSPERMTEDARDQLGIF